MPRNGSSRVHLVLIPGFGGFDALGQLEYYAGVTPLFRHWQAARNRADAVLHYFDNFPTAAVRTRSVRLRNYLAKRITRGEFAPGDSVALVGHSTGGLDIRRLILDLDASPETILPVDGTRVRDDTVTAEQILSFIKRVVFLSVPQRGTNIADWVRAHGPARRAIVAELRASVATSQVPVLDQFQDWISTCATMAAGVDLLYAAQDSLHEAEVCFTGGRLRTALAQEAASQLELWLRHMCSDFSAIDDLACEGDDDSPARFPSDRRTQEQDTWNHRGIRTRSYATQGARPFHFAAGRPAPVWDLLNPFSYPDGNPDSDIVYRWCYRACAGGPFRFPMERGIELWDNDGIVNTGSMLWPDGPDTVLVNADHMDIVGHYQRLRATMPDSRREYQAYDLLASGSGFHDAAFAQVWNGVFDFAAEKQGQAT